MAPMTTKTIIAAIAIIGVVLIGMGLTPVKDAVAKQITDVFVTNNSTNPVPTSVQNTVPTTVQNTVTEQAKSQLIQFVDTPLTVSYPSFGQAFVPFGSSNVLSIDGYRQVCVEAVEAVGNSHTTSYTVDMGKISGNTLSSFIATNNPLGTTINCYDVKGPELALILNGSPSTTDTVQLWVYLRS